MSILLIALARSGTLSIKVPSRSNISNFLSVSFKQINPTKNNNCNYIRAEPLTQIITGSHTKFSAI